MFIWDIRYIITKLTVPSFYYHFQENVIISRLAEILKKLTFESHEVTSLLFTFFGNKHTMTMLTQW